VYRWVDHTAEVELEIEAASEREVLADALAALAELLGVEGEGEVRRTIEVDAPDRPALLAAWLEELAFLAETEGFVPVAIESLDLSEHALRATVAGRRGHPSPIVKAITYHRLTFEDTDTGYRATVVLDV
jgi:SHS2 domain-containing protein